MLADIVEEGARANAEAINSDGGVALALRCDVRQSSDVRGAVETAIDNWGRLDVMFNNAGVNVHGRVGDMSEEAFFECLDLNLASVFRGCQAAAPIMERQRGRIDHQHVIDPGPARLLDLSRLRRGQGRHPGAYPSEWRSSTAARASA